VSDAAQAEALAGLQALIGDSVPPEVLRYALSRHNWNGDETALYVLDGAAARDFGALARARCSGSGGGGGGAAGADGGIGTDRRRDDGGTTASGSAASATATAAAAAAAEEENSAERQRVKAAVMQRFDERPDMSDVTFTPSLPREMLGGGTGRGGGAKKLLRYVDGREVWVGKGERFIVEEVGPAAPPIPASFIKVKKKGQGGATPGFKK
jgi:hypothetical protein